MTLNPNGDTMLDAAPLPNLPSLDKVIAHITAHPEEHNQRTWAVDYSVRSKLVSRSWNLPPCGTAMCVAGHTAHMAGWTMLYNEMGGASECSRDGKTQGIDVVARQELGLTKFEAGCLFNGDNTLDDITAVRDMIADRYHAALAD